MDPLFIGTHNRNKTREISEILRGLPFQIHDLTTFPEIEPATEDGDTLCENAVKKAKYYAQRTGLPALADDTGLEVAALNGEPGVRSARYAGEHCSYLDNNRKLIAALEGKKGAERAATFRCVVACFDPRSQTLRISEGAVEGRILETMQGDQGFGYDPVFYLPALDKTMAQLSLEEKNRVSHRAIAVRKMKEVLECLYRPS